MATSSRGDSRRPGDPWRTRLLVTDSKNTVLAAGDRRIACTAHGYRPAAAALPPVAFNGELLEPDGSYLLGSYRAYNPRLMCFQRPDRLSPFGKGGINAYAYCLGDPVNRVDPTGQSSFLQIVAVGLGMYSLGGLLFVNTSSLALGIPIATLVTDMVVLFLPEGELRDTASIVAMTLSVASAAFTTGVLVKEHRRRAALRAESRERNRRHLNALNAPRMRRRSSVSMSESDASASHGQFGADALPSYAQVEPDLPTYESVSTLRSSTDPLTGQGWRTVQETVETWL